VQNFTKVPLFRPSEIKTAHETTDHVVSDVNYRTHKQTFQTTSLRNGEMWRERITNGHSCSILHMERIASQLKRASIAQNESKWGEWYSKSKEAFNWISNKWQTRLIESNKFSRLCPKGILALTRYERIVFTQRNFAADFLREKYIFTGKK